MGNRAPSGKAVRRSPSCASWPTTRSRSRSRCASSSRRSTIASAPSRGPAREGDRAAGAGPDGDRGLGRVHRHGGALELLLLADPQHQHARRHEPHAAASPPPRRTASTSATPRRRQRPTGRPSSAATRTWARTSRASTASTRSTTARTRRRPPCATRSGAPADEIGEQRGEVRPRQARFPASPTCHGRRSRCRPSRKLLDSLLPTSSSSPARRRAREPDARGAPEPDRSGSPGGARIESDTTGQLLDFLLAP